MEPHPPSRVRASLLDTDFAAKLKLLQSNTMPGSRRAKEAQ